MTANRRIALNVVATYGRSLYAMVLGLFTARWALKDALEALDEKLGEMGARARALAGTYDWRRVAERLTGLYLNRAEGACS